MTAEREYPPPQRPVSTFNSLF